MKNHSKRNFNSFVWHSVFLALTKNFVDVNTVIPTMLLRAGGTSFHLGILTAIMIGGSRFMQLIFGAFLTHKEKTKKYLLLGIYLRVAALLVLGYLLSFADKFVGKGMVGVILLLMTIFSFSGAFAAIAYNDILGKSINTKSRKKFFIIKQGLAATAVLLSALIARKILEIYDYPSNYSILFILAGILLLIGTGGFLMIKEKPTPVDGKPNFIEKLKLFWVALVKDKNLRNYLYMVNTTSLAFAILPFLIFLAKKNFGLTGREIGNYLLLQVIGIILASILFKFLAKGHKYKGILAVHILAGAMLPVFALWLQHNQSWFVLIFLFSGVVLASKEIAIPGILLEISNDRNRAIYTGISGAGSLSIVVFPLIAGALISSWGFTPIFLFVSATVLTSFIFSHKIDCKLK